VTDMVSARIAAHAAPPACNSRGAAGVTTARTHLGHRCRRSSLTR
jgi:hypothetical protein